VAHPLTGISAIYEQDKRRTPIILLVYDTLGGPTSIIAGGRRPGERGIIIDEAIAVKYGLTPGDPMEISDFEFRVTGISANSAAFLTPFAFITYDDLIDFYFESDVAADIATFPLLSFLLVETKPGVLPGAVAERIEQRVKTADVHLPAQLANSDERLGREMLGPILGFLLVVSYFVGALVAAMFMFAAVRGRIRIFGVQKALGVNMRSLATAVTTEAVVLTILAMPVGILLAQGIAGFISEIAPVYLILATEPAAIARTSAACLGLAVLGALVPIRTVARIDPAIVFRS
jgi:ABC-type antimicrobial peptide transport system permease subunit